MKKASPATLLRHCRRALHISQVEARAAKSDVQTYRARATKAEQEAAEWKARFDKLLERLPDDPL